MTSLLPRGTPNELRVVFGQICGEIFGYGAGGVGFGWDLVNLTKTSYGSNRGYRDFQEILILQKHPMQVMDEKNATTKNLSFVC